ncbi:MAG: acyl-ACP--UDP-N-acetylglucosamine O-acyltransferase [Verrucomicrobia subdivision 3 bacterium]|nr:acyl-ACP--UDP-N-acetylglucosamine O-acyltransferase [Limisphaerales bacterium]
MIHSTAVIHPRAQVDSSTRVGPYAVIDADVIVGPQCEIGPHVHLTGLTRIGARNRFHAGCVIGDAPQDLKYQGEPTGLRIGDDNVFREHVTVHRSSKAGEETVVGNSNFLMAGSHVGHNVMLGNYVILANGALLGGYVSVQDRAVISGTCLVHQFTRIGTLAMMQGGSGVSKDLPPFTIARGNNRICGLNIIGLRRAGIAPEIRLELRKLYLHLFRSGKKLRAAVEEAREWCSSPLSIQLLDFVAAAKRGVCRDVSSRDDLDDPDDPEAGID